MKSKLRCLKLGLVALGVVVGAMPADAQTREIRVVEPRIRSRAQLGIEGNLTFRQVGRATTTIVFVEGTRSGTPARLAGLRHGDSIIGINGQRLTVDRWADFRTGLEPGEEVRLTLLRDGDQREVLLEAAAADWVSRSDGASAAWNVDVPEDVQLRVESIQALVMQAFEAARARYAEQPRIAVTLSQADSTMRATFEFMQQTRNGYSYAFKSADDESDSRWVVSAPRADRRDREEEARSDGFTRAEPRSAEALRVFARASEDLRQVARAGAVVLRSSPAKSVFELMPVAPLPVEVMVMHGEVADSLKRDYIILRSEVARVQQEQRHRQMEIVAEARRESARLQESDGVLSSLYGENLRLASELRNLEVQFREIRETEAVAAANIRESLRVHIVTEEPVGGATRVTVRAREGLPAEIRVSPRASSRVSARMVGQHFVMGAQLMDLNPRLSEYFEAEEGVLVVEVLEGTPASDAGILPGDVIVRAGRHIVRKVDDVRRALAEGRPGLRLRVIRKGETLSVRIGG